MNQDQNVFPCGLQLFRTVRIDCIIKHTWTWFCGKEWICLPTPGLPITKRSILTYYLTACLLHVRCMCLARFGARQGFEILENCNMIYNFTIVCEIYFLFHLSFSLFLCCNDPTKMVRYAFKESMQGSAGKKKNIIVLCFWSLRNAYLQACVQCILARVLPPLAS